MAQEEKVESVTLFSTLVSLERKYPSPPTSDTVGSCCKQQDPLVAGEALEMGLAAPKKRLNVQLTHMVSR